MNLFRERVASRLHQDLIGPLSPDEILIDRPTQRYSTGILYPRGARIQPEEDQDGGAAVNEAEDVASNPEEVGGSLHATLKPSVIGLSFAIEQENIKSIPSIQIEIRCAVYRRLAVDDSGNQVEGEPTSRKYERWKRLSIHSSLSVDLHQGESKINMDDHGASGLELYILATPHAGLLTVTTALSNRRNRGDSSAFDEEQHFFQVDLSVTRVLQGHFAPRPSRRAETDEDSRIAALIYRDVKEYVVGHMCSARAILEKNSSVSLLKTEWIPAATVPDVSDKGDVVFDALRLNIESHPLEASWLAKASSSALVSGLNQLVEAYEKWISSERQRISSLPVELQSQAKKHVERCGRGSDRMKEGISLISTDVDVRNAFQLAQAAMSKQFTWTKHEELRWRPFQLAFQLLSIASLATKSHADRDTMDLLWFPTGGGKTEAYLALSAFVIILRRLRSSKENDGCGVAVLMRYTLRLLTVQQFQRAAAMICACEMIRRQALADKSSLNLGEQPIGIGLWVGAAATPLTLQEARSLPSGSSSTPQQLTSCPACGARLHWKLTLKESFVECEEEACEFAKTGSRLPVWTIDEEIYRFTPSLLIGTVDKFAQIVRKPETRSLFGLGSSHLPPDLIIQDELHLISGPLGSIAGLYEIAIDELCRHDGVRPKIIGSTATIRRAEEQIRSLFDRGTYQFPSPGLDAGNSGFAVTDTKKPGRLYLGLTTAGRSATYMLQAIVASLLQAASEPGVSDEERNYYWTLVIYFNSLRELGRALVLMQDDVPVSIDQYAARRTEQGRKIEAPSELTSRVQSYEVRDMLDRLKKGPGDPEAVDLLLASNMISVGMDIPRLGMMVVNAQPKTRSEYVQATSRVGRGAVPGLVVTMYNNMRARDRSHYETFETWHRCLYRDVEATSVTPFASRAQDKALHAVLVALVRHMVPGMERQAIMNNAQKIDVERISALIESRIGRIDPTEKINASRKLRFLIDSWFGRQDLQTYWDDYNRRTSLLMSAEQFAAKVHTDSDPDSEGARRALWPTPNSMREVEPGAPFTLRPVLKVETS